MEAKLQLSQLRAVPDPGILHLMRPLPIIDSCDGCGACCMTQESPPGYAMLLANPQMMDNPGPFAEDVERLRLLPQAAINELRAYLDDVLKKVHRPDEVCIWLNRETKQCRYYDLRPGVCRWLELGSDACREWRDVFGVGSQTVE